MVTTFKRIFDIAFIGAIVLGLIWLAAGAVNGSEGQRAEADSAPVIFASN